MAPSAPWWRRALLYALFAGFALWCVLAFQRDLAQISLAPFKEGWWAVAAAAGLSLFNYALRVMRWQWYMRRAGHRLPWGFTALAFMSGFAFTLSPGKVGEMVRARYYLPKGVPLSATTYYFKDIDDLITDTFALFVERGAVSMAEFWQGTQALQQELVSRLDGSRQAHDEPRPFVRLEWGMYLFTPSIGALRAHSLEVKPLQDYY